MRARQPSAMPGAMLGAIGRAMGSHALLRTLLVAAVLAAQPVAAQTVYVDDRLQIGVHEEPTVASTISELIPSGTALQVLERNEQMARVRTAAGAEGWVDARFLVEQPPGRTRAQALENELAGAQAALADAQARIVALEQRAGAATPPPAADAARTIPSDALREMQMLAEENQRLKQQLAELEAVQRMALERQQAAAAGGAVTAPPRAEAPLATLAPSPPAGRWEDWHLILIASVLLLAFSAGGWMVDWGIRRRHGGFRV